jgi:Secretion system C-terminal sorting domain/Concanavalin A-like lectin/glucanases superfamily
LIKKISIGLILFILGWQLLSAQNLDSGIVARYCFDNNFLDSSTNNYSSVVYGNPVFVADRFGNDSSASLFNGSTDYIRCVIGSHPALAVSVWVRFPFPITNDFPTIFDYGTKAFCLQVDGYTGATAYNYGKVANVVNDSIHVFTNYMLSDGAWHHLFVDVGFPGIGPRIYFDGMYQNHHPWYIGMDVISQYFCIGRVDTSENLWDNYYAGEIDEMRVYNRYLTEFEIIKLYNPSFGFEKNQKESFYLYPNPVKEILWIDTFVHDYYILIYDSNGNKLIYEKSKRKLFLGNLQRGVYFVKIQCDNYKIVKKIIKL